MRRAFAGRGGSRGVAAFVAGCTFLACGSTAQEAPSPDASCTSLYSAVCTQLEACSPVFGILDDTFDACVARRSSDCKKAFLGPNSRGDAAKLQSCFDALAPKTCADLAVFLFENYALPDACDVLHGSGTPNTPCAGNDQCATAVCIEQAPYAPDDDPCGKCSAGVSAGHPCNTLRDCARGLTCAAGVCVPYAAIGESCDDAHPCDAHTYCGSGKCTALHDANESCAATPTACALDLVCNPVTKQCEKPVAPAGGGGIDGATCGTDASGHFLACAHGYVCNQDGSGGLRCVALAQAGDACVDRPCEIPLRCIRGTCQVQSAAACQ